MNNRGLKTCLALLITIGLLAVTWALLYLEPKAGARDALLIVLGALVTLTKDVYGYFFGSSEGSHRKTELLQGATSDQSGQP